MILCSFVWLQYQHMTDRRTGGIVVGNTRLALRAVARKTVTVSFKNHPHSHLLDSFQQD